MRLECPECDATLHVSAVPANGVKCPKCGTRVRPPEPDDEPDEDDAPRRARGKKKSRTKEQGRKFPVMPVAIVSGALVVAAGIIGVLAATRSSKPEAKTESADAGNPAPVIAPGQNPQPNRPGPGNPNAPRPGVSQPAGNPNVPPPEVTELFRAQEDAGDYPPPSIVSASLQAPARGASKMTISVPKGKAPADPPARAAKRTRPEVVAEAEKAAVYIKVTAGGRGNTGSGFLIRATGDTGLVATNAHVVEAAVLSRALGGGAGDIAAVFDSGLRTEAEHTAEVVAFDPEIDLAVLRVTGVEKLPKPIDPRSGYVPPRTTPVLICGFPFGELLSGGRRSPSVTIGEGKVSNLPLGDDGEVDRIQLDGSLNPGNSGGPVLDAEGRLVGVAVATINPRIGSGIGWAVPTARLVAMLDGRVIYPAFVSTGSRDGDVLFRAVVPVGDPLGQLKSASLYVWSGDGTPPAPEKAAGGWKPLAGAREVRLPGTDRGVVVAEVRLPAREGTRPVVFQSALTTKTGETLVSPPVTYQLRVESRQLGGDALPLSALARDPGRYQGRVVAVRGVLAGGPTPRWNLQELPVHGEANDVAPNLSFLAADDLAAQLRQVPIRTGGAAVRLTVRVGPPRPDGTPLRVIRVDFMEGPRLVRTVPADQDEPDQLVALNKKPDRFAGKTVTFEGAMALDVRGTPQSPQFSFFLPGGQPTTNLYFTASGEFADRFRALDIPPGVGERVRVTARVEDRKVGNLRAVTVTKVEFLDRNGSVVQTVE